MNIALTEVDCPSCQTRLSIPNPGRFSCSNCGQEIEVEPQQSYVPKIIEEPVFSAEQKRDLFHEEGTIVSRSQIITPGAVIAVPNISGITNDIIKAKRLWPIISLIIGMLFYREPLIAIVLVIPAAILLFVRRTKYAVVVHCGGTQFNLIFSKLDTAQRATYAISRTMENR